MVAPIVSVIFNAVSFVDQVLLVATVTTVRTQLFDKVGGLEPWFDLKLFGLQGQTQHT